MHWMLKHCVCLNSPHFAVSCPDNAFHLSQQQNKATGCNLIISNLNKILENLTVAFRYLPPDVIILICSDIHSSGVSLNLD